MKRSFLPSFRCFPRRVLSVCAASLLCAAVLPACVGEDGVPRDNTAMLPEDQRVSSVPWNKPQGWENTSQLGALANDPRIGGSGAGIGSGTGGGF